MFTLIATVYKGNKRIGARIINIEGKSGEFLDVPEHNIISVIKEGKAEFNNIEVQGNSLVGTNGTLERYCKLNAQLQLISDKAPLVVLNQLEDVGYTVVDYKGVIKKLKTTDVVEYAKENGIANGKVVSKNNIEFISSIVGNYDIQKLAPSKAGANKGNKEDIGKVTVSISKDTGKVVNNTKTDIDNEINENDVFKSMSAIQKEVLKNYYVWFTVDIYKALAKSIRFDISLNKAEKLTELRGCSDWEFAGVWDAGFLGAAKCELGHSLRYEYYAVPSDDRLNKDRQIVFGETCASDFFNIKPEDMKHLIKARTVMSEEIKIMAEVLSNGLENVYNKRCELLHKVLERLETREEIVRIFGEKVGNTVIAFRLAKLPLPQSLIKLCTKEIKKDIKGFYNSLFPKYITTISKCMDSTSNHNRLLYGANKYLTFIATNKIEGDYAYDPFSETRDHKDEGRYNKQARDERRYLLSILRNYVLCTEFTLVEIENLLDIITSYRNGLEYIKREFYNAFGEWNPKEITQNSSILSYGSPEVKNAYAAFENCMYFVEPAMARGGIRIADSTSRLSYNMDMQRLKANADCVGTEYFSNTVSRIIETIKVEKEEAESERLQQEKERKEAELKDNEEKLRLEREKEEARKDDKVYKLKSLIDQYPDIERTYGIKIAIDIASRNLLYADLSTKQQYWIDNSIKVYEQYANGELNGTNKKAEDSKTVIDNNNYMLEKHPEIKAKVDKIIEMANSVELVEALKASPNGLKITYAVCKYGKASDKQLQQIDILYNALINQ